MKNAPGGMVAGDIAAELNTPANNLYFHLKTLTHSGLVSMVREGRYLRYRAGIPLMLEMIAYLTEECCSGNPAECRRFREASKVAPELLPRIDK